jgi:hypothetical protein
MTASGASALVPTNMGDAMKLADMMAKTGFLAKELQTPGGALFVMEQAMRWQMSPFAVAMETSFISGKPMFSGKIVAAAIVSSGAIAGRIHYDYTGSGEDRAITVSATLRGEQGPRTVTVRLRDARTNNQMWNKQPDQQLAYHGARVWARRHAPEVMLGVWSEEEMEPAQSTIPPARGPVIDAGAEIMAERAPPVVEGPDGWPMLAPDGSLKSAKNAAQWAQWCRVAVGKLESVQALDEWILAMQPHFTALAAWDADAVQSVRQAAGERRAQMMEVGNE